MEYKPTFTIKTIEKYMNSLKKMGFDETLSEVIISDGIIYITDKNNNKSATISKGMLSITIYDIEINETGEKK